MRFDKMRCSTRYLQDCIYKMIRITVSRNLYAGYLLAFSIQDIPQRIEFVPPDPTQIPLRKIRVWSSHNLSLFPNRFQPPLPSMTTSTSRFQFSPLSLSPHSSRLLGLLIFHTRSGKTTVSPPLALTCALARIPSVMLKSISKLQGQISAHLPSFPPLAEGVIKLTQTTA